MSNSNFFSFLYLFKLFELSKYMIIYKIGNLWNFDSFPNCKILKSCYFSKLYNFRNLGHFWNFPNSTIFGIVQIGKLTRFLEFLKFGKPKFDCNNWQFWNCSSIRYSALLAIVLILIFAL